MSALQASYEWSPSMKIKSTSPTNPLVPCVPPAPAAPSVFAAASESLTTGSARSAKPNSEKFRWKISSVLAFPSD